MTPGQLGEILGLPPTPRGTWADEALYVSSAALRRERPPGELAARLRALPGIADVRVSGGGLLEIVVSVPGELVTEIGPAAPVAPAAPIASNVRNAAGVSGGRDVEGGSGARGVSGDRLLVGASPWADFPRTWRNPGFVVRYAHWRAVAVQRWAAELGVGGEFRPELLDGPRDRAVLRLLAEVHGRRRSREPGWAAYAGRLALAYHDAFEGAPALPKGEEGPTALHAARVRLAGAVRDVLAETLAVFGETAPDRL
ncbi:anticodon-binding protein [Streptosporangium sp. NPDC006007]|uniref:anticodon-binding protein n=1 Tax=Streptosporangium sp. NPDC006007 TaxID=3154575 RepID=UPI0033A0E4C0